MIVPMTYPQPFQVTIRCELHIGRGSFFACSMAGTEKRSGVELGIPVELAPKKSVKISPQESRQGLQLHQPWFIMVHQFL